VAKKLVDEAGILSLPGRLSVQGGTICAGIVIYQDIPRAISRFAKCEPDAGHFGAYKCGL
jgi:hypothetical protein